MKFSSAGSMGDTVYQTLLMLEVAERLKDSIEEIHLQVEKPSVFYKEHVYGNVCLSTKAAEFLAPLLELQGWHTTISKDVPEDCIDLDAFRKLRLNFSANDIRLWRL